MSSVEQIIQVDFACNDENGLFMGFAERVAIGDLNLECRLWGGGVILRQLTKVTNGNDERFLRVGRVLVRSKGYRYGVGNWCWDGYWMSGEDAIRIINYLEKQKYWACDEAPTELFDKFKAKQPFTAEDLKLCLTP